MNKTNKEPIEAKSFLIVTALGSKIDIPKSILEDLRKAINLLCNEAKREIFDDIERFRGGFTNGIVIPVKNYEEFKKKHLNTQDTDGGNKDEKINS